MYKADNKPEPNTEFARQALPEGVYKLLVAFRRRCVDLYGPILGNDRVEQDFDRHFWENEDTVKHYASLSREEHAEQLRAFDQALHSEASKVVVDDSPAADERDPDAIAAIDEDDEDIAFALGGSDDLEGLEEPLSPEEQSVEGYMIRADRPRTRADCPPYRPCPYVTCRYHLYLDVTRRGRMRYNFPEVDVTELDMSCALDLAERGPRTLEEIGSIMGGISRERVRQIEQAALTLLRMRGGRALAEFLEERDSVPQPVKASKKNGAARKGAKGDPADLLDEIEEPKPEPKRRKAPVGDDDAIGLSAAAPSPRLRSKKVATTEPTSTEGQVARSKR